MNMYFYKSCRKRVFFIPLEEKEDNPSKFEALEEIVEIEEAGAWLNIILVFMIGSSLKNLALTRREWEKGLVFV